jgi:hypothetical protein
VLSQTPSWFFCFLFTETPTLASFEETISCHKNTILCKLRRINFLSNKNTFPSKPPRSKFLSQEHLPLQALKKQFLSQKAPSLGNF